MVSQNFLVPVSRLFFLSFLINFLLTGLFVISPVLSAFCHFSCLSSLFLSHHSSHFVSVCLCEGVFVCVCVCVRRGKSAKFNTSRCCTKRHRGEVAPQGAKFCPGENWKDNLNFMFKRIGFKRLTCHHWWIIYWTCGSSWGNYFHSRVLEELIFVPGPYYTQTKDTQKKEKNLCPNEKN